MLAMKRSSGEYIVIGGDIVVQVIEVGGQIRLGVDAPREITIERGEVYERHSPPPSCIQYNRARTDAPKSLVSTARA